MTYSCLINSNGGFSLILWSKCEVNSILLESKTCSDDVTICRPIFLSCRPILLNTVHHPYQRSHCINPWLHCASFAASPQALVIRPFSVCNPTENCGNDNAVRHLRIWGRKAEHYQAANTEGQSRRAIGPLLRWCYLWSHKFLSYGLVHLVYIFMHLVFLLHHISLSIDVTVGDNLVDRSVDLCTEAFKLIAYDPLQGTHPALGVVDHVSTCDDVLRYRHPYVFVLELFTISHQFFIFTCP